MWAFKSEYCGFKLPDHGQYTEYYTDLVDSVAPLLVQHLDRVAAEPDMAAYYAGRVK